MRSHASLSSLIEVMQVRAAEQPNGRAFTYLGDGETEAGSLTYGEIDRRARAIAATLQRYEIGGQRVLLLYSSALEFVPAFFGVLYSGAIAVTAPLPASVRLARTLPRLEAIVTDANAKIGLTTLLAMNDVRGMFSASRELAALKWLSTDTIPSNRAEHWQQPEVDSETLAFLQYTSGSTAAPKGVMVSHGNVLHNSECIKLNWGYTRESVSV
ncbi:MAG TPA: AMP-binding protein, partial [Blastocatellia bacterium]|nr:AMP-binding protein [Blastocatellia bacterium]